MVSTVDTCVVWSVLWSVLEILVLCGQYCGQYWRYLCCVVSTVVSTGVTCVVWPVLWSVLEVLVLCGQYRTCVLCGWLYRSVDCVDVSISHDIYVIV